MSGLIVHDGRPAVNMPTPARLAGRSRAADLSCWDVAAVQGDMGRKRTAELRQELDALRNLPPDVRVACWHYALAIGLLCADRAMVLEVVDGAEPAEGVA